MAIYILISQKDNNFGSGTYKLSCVGANHHQQPFSIKKKSKVLNDFKLGNDDYGCQGD